MNITKDYAEIVEKVATSLKNKTLLVTTILVSKQLIYNMHPKLN